jgi:hypothetical protein
MGGDGQRDGELTVVDGAARRRWTARRQLDGEERRDGDLTMMDNEERREAMAMSTGPAMGAKRPMRHYIIKCSSLIKLNHIFIPCYFLIPVHHLPPTSRYHEFSGCPNHDDSIHVDARTTIVTPHTSSPMC